MKYFLHILIALSLISCHDNEKDKAIFIDLSDIQLSDETTSFKILDTIELEETSKSQIQKIHKISVTDNYLFVLDKALKYVYQFNKNGKFIKRFTDFGDAPHQSININDYTLDLKHQYLYILSVNDRKILKFDFKGNFIKSQRLSFECYDIDFIGKSNLLTRGAYFDEEGYNVKLYNFKDNKILEQFMPYPKDVFPVDFGFIMGGTSFQNDLYLMNNPLDNTIYGFNTSKRQFESKFVLNFGEYQWPDVKRYDFRQFMKVLGQNKYSYISPYFFENKRLLYLKYNVSNSEQIVDYRYLFFDKINHEKYIFKPQEKNQSIYKNTLLLKDSIFYSSFKTQLLDIKTTDSIVLETNPKILLYKLTVD